MATWEELQARLRTTYKLVQDQATWVAMGWTFPGDPPIRQLVSVACEAAVGRPWLVIGADAGPATAIPPAQALARNADMAMGALATIGGNCIVRFACPMDAATWDLVELALRLLASEAVKIRNGSAASGTAEAFRAYAD